MRVVRWTGILIAGVAFATGVSEPAGTLYDNINTNVEGYVTVFGSHALYNSFSTGSSAVSLTDVRVKLDLRSGGPVSGGFVTVALYSNSSNTPGPVITTIGTVSDSAVATTDPGNVGAAYDFTVSIALAANTRYWIGLTAANGSAVQWAWNDLSDGGFGNIGEYHCYAGSCSQNDGDDGPAADPFLMFLLSGTPGVPAVSPVGLAGLGILLLAIPLWLIRKRYRLGS